MLCLGHVMREILPRHHVPLALNLTLIIIDVSSLMRHDLRLKQRQHQLERGYVRSGLHACLCVIVIQRHRRHLYGVRSMALLMLTSLSGLYGVPIDCRIRLLRLFSRLMTILRSRRPISTDRVLLR